MVQEGGSHFKLSFAYLPRYSTAINAKMDELLVEL